MTRGTALVTTKARVVQLTGKQNLDNLTTSLELSLPDLLVTASDAIFDQLESDGHEPGDLENETAYERAVAWHFLALLVIGGYLECPAGLNPPQNEKGQASAYAWSDPYYEKVRPRFASSDSPSTAPTGIPGVSNLTDEPFFTL